MRDCIVATADLPITTLRPHESTTAICVSVMNFVKPITMADVEISIFYKYFGWRRNERFRFVTIQDSEGNLNWAPRPMSEK